MDVFQLPVQVVLLEPEVVLGVTLKPRPRVVVLLEFQVVEVNVVALELLPQDSAPAVAGRPTKLLKLSETDPTLTSYFVKLSAAAGTLNEPE